MPNERRPSRPVPRGKVVENSVKHRVADGESWQTLATRYGVTAEQIILANFETTVPEEVNWYLREYVGCRKPTADRRNWTFSSSASPGIIQIPPRTFTFDEPLVIEGVLPPRYYTVNVHPSQWTASVDRASEAEDAKKVVTMAPWSHGSMTIGKVRVKGRSEWGAHEPTWSNEVIYYNTAYPLTNTLQTIVVHHTDNDDAIKTVEKDAKGKGYAAIGYHFFIDKAGTVYEGRPLEIMGSHAGTGKNAPGPMNDPDWGAIGIVLQGDYHSGGGIFGAFTPTPPAAQLQSLEDLIVGLRAQYQIRTLLMHREVVRGGTATVCPGDQLVPKVEALRKKLAF